VNRSHSPGPETALTPSVPEPATVRRAPLLYPQLPYWLWDMATVSCRAEGSCLPELLPVCSGRQLFFRIDEWLIWKFINMEENKQYASDIVNVKHVETSVGHSPNVRNGPHSVNPEPARQQQTSSPPSLGQECPRRRQQKPPIQSLITRYTIRCIVSTLQDKWSRALCSPDSLEASALHGLSSPLYEAASHIALCPASHPGPLELLLELPSLPALFL
jgi:hypothetical protein